ncbi:MAG: apolipoprotein N-acyltransferase [Alphaproteobacteria bacterium]
MASRRRVAALVGWRRWLCAALLGAAAAMAFPPLYILPFAFVGFAGLVWLIDGAGDGRNPSRAAFAAGWWFGFGHFVAGLYWITNALMVDAAKFGWLVPFAVAGLSAYFALYPALAALATRLTGATGVRRIVMLAVAWTACEWLRGMVLTGFPWNLMGTVWAWSDDMIQLTAFTGTYGLSLMAVFAAAVPATLADAPLDQPRLRRWRAVMATAGLVGLVWLGGAARLALAPQYGAPQYGAGGGPAMVADVRLRLVQGNIDQRDKWRTGQRSINFRKYLRLSAAGAVTPGAVTHIIWPETAAPYVLANDAAARAAVARVVPPSGVVITGALRATRAGVKPFQVWNSIYAVDGGGNVLASYDKFHLVPFGEFVPFRGLLPLTKLTAGTVDFSAGPGPRTYKLPGLPPMSPLICYEVIFPANVLDAEDRPAWLLNLTNDAWFGISTGPYQHFAAARLRAVEQGLPLVRAANTGISAVVDPYGRTIARLGLGVEGILDSPLPRALPSLTLYGRFGDWVLLWLLLAALIPALFLRRPT